MPGSPPYHYIGRFVSESRECACQSQTQPPLLLLLVHIRPVFLCPVSLLLYRMTNITTFWIPKADSTRYNCINVIINNNNTLILNRRF